MGIGKRMRQRKKRLLILDNSNLFLRNYVINPSLSRNGQHIGGIIGTLKSIQKVCQETKPDKIVIAWDGRYGSSRRRSINKNYKDGRRPIKFNWDSTNMNENELLENKIYQMSQLSLYYDNFPLYQFLFENVEADDVISYVCQLKDFEEYKKIIVSSDQDFIQLINRDTILYRAGQKEILNEERVIEKFGISPNNFAVARSIVGDKSDAIEGVSGVGMPTVAKRFPQFSESKTILLDDLYRACEEKIKDKKSPKIYSNILSSKEKIKENYSLIQLSNPSLSIQEANIIRETIRTHSLVFNKTEFRRLLITDGAGEWNWDNLYACFNRIVNENKS